MKRMMGYSTRSQVSAAYWQRELREKLFHILQLDDLAGTGHGIPFAAREIWSQRKEYGQLKEIEINSTMGRRIRVLLGSPAQSAALRPAIVSIHGHGGDRYQVFERQTPYHGFAASLTEHGYITIATDVGQHEVYEAGRILMGERLWDLMRCVDYLTTVPQVDTSRIGCAGLSLGGEMAMWLGAMDERVCATVSAGFLTTMDQMEQNHCMCWKFPGLRELVDYADIYSLVAPRALQCQNGSKEPPTQFPPSIARKVMAQIELAYSDWGKPDRAELVVHDGGHEIELDSLLSFLGEYLG